MSEGGVAWLRVWEGIRQAGQVITGHKLRSILLMFGVCIGVSTLLAIFTVVSGGSDKIRDDIVAATKPYLYIARYTGMGGEDIEKLLRRPQLKPECIEPLQEIEGVEFVDYMVSNNDVTILQYGEERTHFVQIVGTSENFPYMYSFVLGDGRIFTPAELISRTRVCVLGYGPRADLFPHADPIGKTLRLEGRVYTIIGTMAQQRTIMGQLGENYVVVPWTSFEKDFLFTGEEDRTLAVTVADGFDTDTVAADVTGALRKVRRLRPGEPNDFEVVASETYAEMIDKVTGALTLILVILSSIGLMVGGIGVVNIMLISVTERTREIGIRRALGARRQDVLLQVLIEAGVLTGIGGIGGIGVGYLLSWLLTRTFGFPLNLSPLLTLFAVLFSVGIGLVFGLYPADRAARLDPIEALRRE